MICPKCGSEKVTVEIATDTTLKTKKRSLAWWIFVGWWWLPFKWFFFFLPALIVKILSPKKYVLHTEHRSVCICQKCGYHGDIDEFRRV